MARAALSGRQYSLRRGRQRAVAVEVGGGLRAYRVAGFDVLDGYGRDQIAGAARGAVLVPWPNRLADGTYDFDGHRHQVALTEPALRNAIHGLGRWVAWECTREDADRVRLRALLHPQPGYEFTLEVEVEYALTAGGLEVAIRSRNRGRRPLPYGAGQHPYVRASGAAIDGQVLVSPGRRRLVLDARQIPTGAQRRVAGRFDFRRPRPVGATVLDDAFTDLERGRDGLARVALSGPERRVSVWMDGAFEHLMLFTGDTLAPEERRRSLGVEPMTCAPNAFRNGLGLVTLEPGARAVAHWGIGVEN